MQVNCSSLWQGTSCLMVRIVSNIPNMLDNIHMDANYPTNASRVSAKPIGFHAAHPTTNDVDKILRNWM
jgi:hypothetical protein